MQSLGKWLSLAIPRSTDWPKMVFSSEAEEQNFDARLNETRIWCSLHGEFADPAASLRSEQLKPEVMVGKGSEAAWNHLHPDVAGSVLRLSEIRANLIKSDGKPASQHAGRLLVFWPEETLDCGAATFSSRGYFDAGNAPPWDTWLWFGQVRNQPPALISWVPDEFIPLVEEGLAANPEQCIQWL